MEGQRVVLLLLGGVALTAGLFWKVGFDTRDAITREAELQGLKELPRMEAAERVAREDMFGLPSRLADPPERAMERPFHEATTASPLPVTPEGIAQLLEIYAVTIRACSGRLPPAMRSEESLSAWITVTTLDGFGRVTSVDGLGEGQVEGPFTRCLAGSLSPAVFEQPANGERTLLATVKLPQ